MSEYNYESFPLDGDMEDFLRFPDVARAGTKAPEGELVDASDETVVRLEELYRRGTTVVEFGSFT